MKNSGKMLNSTQPKISSPNPSMPPPTSEIEKIEAREFSESIRLIFSAFADIAFGIHPFQEATKDSSNISFHSEADYSQSLHDVFIEWREL